MQLHVPYSGHAKAPVGPTAIGLPLAVDPKKLGERWGPAEGREQGKAPHLDGGASRLLSLTPVPFSGVKQEQLSPRGQAGPPESLGVPTAQETSVLRGGCGRVRTPSACDTQRWAALGGTHSTITAGSFRGISGRGIRRKHH